MKIIREISKVGRDAIDAIFNIAKKCFVELYDSLKFTFYWKRMIFPDD